MSSRSPIGAREADIARIAESDSAVASLRQHLKEIVDGTAFNGSHRSAQFLGYIVERAIAGDFESLKERVIGVELFGRSPSYNTGEDAIVRVTASDVRKRLLQHYGTYGPSSGLRISLPLGSYVPEIACEQPPVLAESAGAVATAVTTDVLEHVPALQGPVALAPEPTRIPDAVVTAENGLAETRSSVRRWQLIALLLLIGNLALAALTWREQDAQKTRLLTFCPGRHSSRRRAPRM